MPRLSSIGVAAYVLLVYITFALYSIGHSAEALRAAVAHKDVESLLRYVDLPAIREGVRRQLKTSLLSTARSHSKHIEGDDSVGARETALALQLTDDVIDLHLSREGVGQFFQSLNGQAELPTAAGAAPAARVFSELKSSRMLDVDRLSLLSPLSFVASGTDSSGRAFGFVFSFRGLRWVLTDVLLDESAIDERDVVEFIRSLSGGNSGK